MALESTQTVTEMSTRNISRGVKRPVRKADNLHVPIVLKSGSLNLLEPSTTVQACNGIARWGWVVNVMPRPLYLRERDPVRIVQGAG
jgi:hypothetical protein